jgi:hypothetical protein
MAIAQPTGFAEPLIATAAPFRGWLSTPPLQARVEVLVRDRSGQWRKLKFVVDSGAGVTSIPWAVASRDGIPIGTTRVNTPLVTMQGLVNIPCYRNTIEIEFPRLPGRQFVFDCQFPDVPATVPPVLGIGGDVLRQLLIRFDGTPRLPHAAYGCVLIDVPPPPAVAPSAPPPRRSKRVRKARSKKKSD